jgi:alpha-L-rhamnosidase
MKIHNLSSSGGVDEVCVKTLRIAALAVLALSPAAAWAAVGAGELRCEYLKNPLGIDARLPRLSWILTSQERGVRQTAYHVLVASSAENLAADEGDLWDSGRVESEQSIHVRYAGKPLGSHAECFWKVRAWDASGEPSAWSEPARWSMGLLEPGDWQANWIGLDGDASPKFLADTNWIWFPEGNPAESAPTETRYFRRTFTLPPDRRVTKATLRITADDRCNMFLNGRDIGSRSGHQSAKEMDVTHRLQPGPNVLAVTARNEGGEPNPAALVAWMKIEFDAGEPMVIVTDEQWTTAKTEAPHWTALDFDDSAWTAVKKLGPVGMEPWGNVRHAEDRRLPARYLRKEFALDKNVRRAAVYFSGVGLSELYVNGRKIGDAVLSPAMTQYPKRILYVTHDITDQLRRGDNAIGVILGNGRYYSPRSEVYAAMPTYGFPKLLLHLRVEHEDGSVTTEVSDPSWKLTDDGPILANNEYDGEEYDARKELGLWSSPGYDDGDWQAANPAAVPEGEVRAEMIEPIRVTETLRPIAVTEPRPGVYVFDMGQNLVGWCRLRVGGPAGTEVKLVHAETLQPDGNLYLANIRGARVTDVYTLSGVEPLEVWEPRFTYHGFRYVEVSGWPGTPTLASIEGRVVHDDVERTGQFACSNSLLNKIHENIVWGTRGNYRSVPTDCPQRDERQGWLGDRGEESRGEMYLFDNAALYSKWLQDMEDSQKESGSVPDVCPAHWPIYSDNVTWPSSTVIIPNSLHRQFGDADVIARHYGSAKKWVDYMLTFVKDGIIERDQYGDWCVPPEDPKLIHSQDPARQTAKPLLATAYFYYDLRLMERYAAMLGKSDDAARFARLADEMKAAFNAKFYNRELGQYDNGSQTSSVLPLYFRLVPDDQRQRVFDHLVNKITKETNNHIGTGLIGGQFLNRVLSDGGRPDLAYTIASQTDYPSWGYMIGKGATTIWELWNGDTADPAMNSGNHVMLVGDLAILFYEYLAGIRPDEATPGFKHVTMRPEPVPGLDWVKASHRSPYGLIESAWERNGDVFTWHITVPANATATAYVPAKDSASVTESGKPVAEATGVEVVDLEDGRAVLRLGSGKYAFASEM